MKRLLITLSAIGCLFADIDVTGNWKLSGLKVDYLHIARETTDIEICAQVNPDLCVTLATIPAGVVYTTFVNGPFTIDDIDEDQLNLNVNLWPDGTGYIAEGSYYPDIDLIPGTCITSPQIFPVTDEFVWELAGAHNFAPTNIIGTPSANDLAGGGNEVYGFGVSQSGTFDGWPSTALPERVPAGLPYVALPDGTVLGASCETAIISSTCATLGIDAAADPAGCQAALVGAGLLVGDGSGSVEQGIYACATSDYATALAGFGGAGWLHGSGSSGYIGLDQGDSQMGQDLNVDLELEWNAIDGATSQSGIDEDGSLNRIFGYPYLESTHVLDTPECDITGGSGLNHPLVGDVVTTLGGPDVLAAFLTGGCIETVAANAYGGCIASVSANVVGLCNAYGSPANSVTALCSDAAAGDANENGVADVQESCEVYGVDAAVGGACQALGFSAEICGTAGAVASAGIADACQSGVEAGALAACDGAGGLWNTLYGGCLAQYTNPLPSDESICGVSRGCELPISAIPQT